MNDFQKTVNLRKPADEERERIQNPERKVIKKAKKENPPSPPRHGSGPRRDKESRAEGIDQVYRDETPEVESQKEMHTISRPEIRPSYENLYKRVVMILALVLVIGAVYFLFFRDIPPSAEELTNQSNRWYSVELNTSEIYYGQVANMKDNPIEIRNVYYNYDQLNPETDVEPGNTNNLKLIKRGKETHGPSGTMYIYQTQIKLIDELKEDSKVLKAILEHEN